MCGKQFMCKTNFATLKPKLKTKILHFNGSQKMVALERTLEGK